MVSIIACSSTVVEKKIRKHNSVCPVIITDKNTDNLLLKTNGQKETRLFATIQTDHIVCSLNNNIMTLNFNVTVNADKKEALKESKNAYIPINYYIIMNLTSFDTKNKNSHPTQKTSKGVYFVTLKEINNNKMTASKKHTISLLTKNYTWDKSTINIGFISEDKTVVLY